jgi:SEL1 protein
MCFLDCVILLKFFLFQGKLYLEGGNFAKQDNLTAFTFFRKAAEKNNPIGQAGLGLMYFYGSSGIVEQDYQSALKYFQLSSDQGYVEGHFLLAIMYYYGYGVRRDYKMAVKFFNLAAQLGHVLAYYNLAQMHSKGMGILRSCQTAAELYKNVAERGQWSSMFMEAHSAYKDGDIDKALIKYIFLAELGYEVAQSNVAYILDQCKYIKRLFDWPIKLIFFHKKKLKQICSRVPMHTNGLCCSGIVPPNKATTWLA